MGASVRARRAALYASDDDRLRMPAPQPTDDAAAADAAAAEIAVSPGSSNFARKGPSCDR